MIIQISMRHIRHKVKLSYFPTAKVLFPRIEIKKYQ